MIIIKENTCRLDTQLDRFQQQVIEKIRDDVAVDSIGSADRFQYRSQQLVALQSAVQSLSITSTTHNLLKPDKLVTLISDVSRRLPKQHEGPVDEYTAHELDLFWLVTAKAAIQTLGLLLNSFVEQTHVFSDEILYWDEILDSSWSTWLHLVQTSPLRIWHGARGLYSYTANRVTQDRHYHSMSARWAHFYDLLRQSVRLHPTYSMRNIISSHLATCRSDVRRKQKSLKTMRDLLASSIGLLMEECLSFNLGNDNKISGNQWRDTVLRSVILMETILCNTTDEIGVADFEHKVLTMTNAEEHSVMGQLNEGLISEHPGILIDRLVHILQDLLPKYQLSSKVVARKYGHPSRLMRYWLPFSLLLFSASTSLKILANKRTEIIRWILEIGSTAVDFWSNWVVEPIQRLIGTIRHDKASEIAIMSKNSLEADRASLERMVVDFVQDHQTLTKGDPAATDKLTITNSVREGDLTPVLKAYERDLRSPFVGTVRGDLIRALLIQIQKTKVDVEIAMSGIDSLLKSQELVFGFVGITPGILVSYSVFQWICGLFGSRKGLRRNEEHHQLRHALRNVDRTLAGSSLTTNGILNFKDHGLLICDAEYLLQRARAVLKGADFRKFNEDVSDLIDIQRGADRQLQVVRRIGYTYSRWFQ